MREKRDTEDKMRNEKMGLQFCDAKAEFRLDVYSTHMHTHTHTHILTGTPILSVFLTERVEIK